MENVENIRYQTCGCDYFKAKGKNIRFVWPIILAVAGVLLVLFLLGSALGCEACFECAAACGMDDLEDCGRDCDEQTDSCFTCEGVTCGDRVGCFSCNGKWDCSTCGGKVIYTLTIVLDENNEESYTIPAEELAEVTHISPKYIPGQGSTYYEFLGYYTKKTGGRLVADADGNVIGKLSGTMTLYARYQEKGVGQEYVLKFDTAGYFETPADISATVGEEVTDMPEAGYVEGYTFQGWYNTNGNKVVGANEENWEFHLYLAEHNPENDSNVIMLHARYEKNQYNLTFHYDNNSTESVLVEHGTIVGDIWNTYNRSGDDVYYKFFGWAKNKEDASSNTESGVEGSFAIIEDTDLYEIRRDWITLTFHTNSYNALYDQTINYIYYEGETVLFNTLEHGGLNLNNWMSLDAINPGYKFDGWCAGSQYGTVQESVTVQDYNYKVFYAKWTPVRYTITYMSEDDVDITSYAQANGALTTYSFGVGGQLWDYGALWGRTDFLGWYIDGTSPYQYFRELPQTQYGNIKLRPVFSNML